MFAPAVARSLLTSRATPIAAFCTPRVMVTRRRGPAKPAGLKNSSKRWRVRPRARLPAVIAVALASALVLRLLNRRGAMQRFLRSPRSRTGNGSTWQTKAPVFGVDVVNEFEHDLYAFTQGLLFHNGQMYESTGLEGRSTVRRVDVQTGRVVEQHSLSDEHFGEGLAVVGHDRLLQLLWRHEHAYLYDAESLMPLQKPAYSGEGWGVAQVSPGSEQVFFSNGSSTIRVYSVHNDSLQTQREFVVKDGKHEVGLLNELEVVNGELWANVLGTELIARINTQTGRVNSWLDLRGLLKRDAIPAEHSIDVMNGIAYDPGNKAVYVTGKLWPKLFEIRATRRRVAGSVSDVTNAFFLSAQNVAHFRKTFLA